MSYFLGALYAAILAASFVPFLLGLARRFGLYDLPGERKIHELPTPRIGGIGIFHASILAFGIGFWGFELWQDGGARVGYAATVMIGAFAVHVLGLLDDLRSLRARTRLFVELGVGLAFLASVLLGGAGLPVFALLPGLELSGLFFLVPLYLLWIVGLTNAMNMIDGMDGLSSGLGIIAAFGLALLRADDGSSAPALIGFCLVGALAGFLLFNFPPARIFMGDSGSYFLGFVLAGLTLAPGGNEPGFALWDGASLLAIPLTDAALAILRRARAGRSILSADRGHLHHRLIDLGLSHRAILALVYVAAMVICALILSSRALPRSWHWTLIAAAWLVDSALFVGVHTAVRAKLRQEHRRHLAVLP